MLSALALHVGYIFLQKIKTYTYLFQCFERYVGLDNYIYGRRVIGISGFLIWSKSLMELIFNPCGEFR